MADQIADAVIGKVAIDIVRLSKMQAPHKTGALQTSNHGPIRLGLAKFKIAYSTPYARRWEYETPPNGFREGKKSRYLRDPAEQMADPRRVVEILRSELENIHV